VYGKNTCAILVYKRECASLIYHPEGITLETAVIEETIYGSLFVLGPSSQSKLCLKQSVLWASLPSRSLLITPADVV
jgi:hypothetical protein